MRGPPAPSISSLLRSLEEGAAVSLPAPKITMDLEPKTDVSTEDFLHIPLQRPWRVWLILGSIGLFSALSGAVFGIRSQDGGPRARLEHRVGNVQSDVADLHGAVTVLEAQGSTFASSINALDARLITQEQHKLAPAPAIVVRPGVEKRGSPVERQLDRDPRARAARSNVRQAMRQLDAVLPGDPLPE